MSVSEGLHKGGSGLGLALLWVAGILSFFLPFHSPTAFSGTTLAHPAETFRMKWGWVLLGLLVAFGQLSWGQKGLDIPEYDGRDRVVDLNIKNFKSVMKKYDVFVIYYHEHVGNSRVAQKQFEIEELALEVGCSGPNHWGEIGRGLDASLIKLRNAVPGESKCSDTRL